MASKELLQHNTESPFLYDPASDQLIKKGEDLKKGDLVLQKVSPDKTESSEDVAWVVSDIKYVEHLQAEEVVLDESYVVYDALTKQIRSCVCVGIDRESKTVKFKHQNGVVVPARTDRWPLVYPAGTTEQREAVSLQLKCLSKDKRGRNRSMTLDWKKGVVVGENFVVDVSNSHVILCTGKPRDESFHFEVTSTEPHGVCCTSGLKVSMGMHRFGNKRWGQGIADDIRSHKDQNTR